MLDEKPSRYFLNKEKRAQKKVIEELEVGKGVTVSELNDIMKHVRDFYKQLFEKRTGRS